MYKRKEPGQGAETHPGDARKVRSMKRIDPLILIAGLIILYGPYVLTGGLLGDDLGLLIVRPYLAKSNYLQFQWAISSFHNLTIRPVSAILQGLCLWHFGTTAWAFHLVNLALFGGSLLFFYHAIKNALSRDIALFASLSALVYPCASATVFSSIMMNSNLAGLFWSSSLYVSTRPFKGKGILVAILLVLSALSYEAFIPLFLLNILFSLVKSNGEKPKKWQGLARAIPVFIAILVAGVYQVFLRKAIFELLFKLGFQDYYSKAKSLSFSKLQIYPLTDSILRFYHSLILAAKITFFYSLTISKRALSNLGILSPYYLILVILGLGALGFYTYRRIKDSSRDPPHETQYLQRLIERYTTLRITGFPQLDLCATALLVFCCSYFIFVFSEYLPNPFGYGSGTLGGIRYSTALLLAAATTSLYHLFTRKWPKRLVASFFIGLIALFTLSMIGQREGWVAAARYNDSILRHINKALHQNHLDETKLLTLVVERPENFPHQINEEPIFSVPWDIGNALSLANPIMIIHANVYHPQLTYVYNDRIQINNSGPPDEVWKAFYPFYFYKFETNKIYPITSEEDWHGAVNETEPKGK